MRVRLSQKHGRNRRLGSRESADKEVLVFFLLAARELKSLFFLLHVQKKQSADLDRRDRSDSF